MTRYDEGDLTWVFDPVPASGAIKGGDPTSYVFHESLDTFVREVLQNANDQRLGGWPVRVEFSFHELTGSRASDALAALAWDTLEQHVRGVAGSRSLIAGRMSQILENSDDGRLLLLRIDDFGTRGLFGDEDGFEGNFAPLCKHVLVTTDDKAAKGGSHGLGKAVLWSFSGLSTVLFSSTVGEDPVQFRLFGRTELPYHETGSDAWSGPGWFGMPEETSRGLRAVSAFGRRTLAGRACLDRAPEAGTGTTIGLLGFMEPDQETPRRPAEVAADILSSAARWFWPRLLDGSLEVRASVFDNADCVFDADAEPGRAEQPFVIALQSGATVASALEAGDVAERLLTVHVPRKRGAGDQSVEPEGQVTLKLRRNGPELEGQSPLDKTIALVRGAGMVVRYWKPRQLPLDVESFSGVLIAGRLHGDEESDDIIEDFLRAAEPPAHNDWSHGTNNLRSNYQPGAKARLDELWNKLSLSVLDACRSIPPPEKEGPKALARYFKLGGGPGPTPTAQKFRVHLANVELVGGRWVASGNVKRLRGDRPWAIDLSLWLEGETGQGERLRVTELSGSEDEVEVKKRPDGSGMLTVPAATSEAGFSLSAEPGPGSDIGTGLLARTRARLTVRPHETTV